MDREKLVEAMAEAINASSAATLPWAKLIDEAAQYPYSETWVRFCRDAARAALAVAEPAVREWCAAQLITRADELRAMGTEKDTPDGVARECRSQSHALRVEAAILRTRGTP